MLYQSVMSSPYLLNTDQLRQMREHGIIRQSELVELIDEQLYRVPTDDDEHQGAATKAFVAIDRLLQGVSGDKA